MFPAQKRQIKTMKRPNDCWDVMGWPKAIIEMTILAHWVDGTDTDTRKTIRKITIIKPF